MRNYQKQISTNELYKKKNKRNIEVEEHLTNYLYFVYCKLVFSD